MQSDRTEMTETYVPKRDLPHIPVRDQTQRALDDQLSDLVGVATKLGLYDAADFLREAVRDQIKPTSQMTVELHSFKEACAHLETGGCVRQYGNNWPRYQKTKFDGVAQVMYAGSYGESAIFGRTGWAGFTKQEQESRAWILEPTRHEFPE